MIIKEVRGENMRQGSYFKDFEKIVDVKKRYDKGIETTYKKMNKEVFINRFNRAYKSLKYCYRHIINEAYLKDNYKFWWLEEFEHTTYYRNRSRAVKTFLLVFNACI